MVVARWREGSSASARNRQQPGSEQLSADLPLIGVSAMGDYMLRSFSRPPQRYLIGTDAPDETSVRALRPKTLRLTLDVTETLSCYSQSARTILGRMQHYCFVRGAAEVRQVWGQLFGGRFEDRRFAGEGV